MTQTMGEERKDRVLKKRTTGLTCRYHGRRVGLTRRTEEAGEERVFKTRTTKVEYRYGW
jgi:hypothetical protein